MANNIIGLDLGSHTVKAVIVKVALKGSEIIGFESEPVTLDENGWSTQEAVLEATARLAQRMNLQHTTIHCAAPGELASVRKIELPKSAAKKLEQVLKFELDETLPFDIGDAVYDFVEMARDGDKIVVLAAAMLHEQVKDLLDGLSRCGINPHEIGVAPLSYRAFFEARDAKKQEVAAFVDLGHVRTTIAVFDENVPTGRTILRGGRDLTARLSQALKIPYEEAEVYKQHHGLAGNVGGVLREALKPLIREVRQTLKGHLAAGGHRVTRVLLAGGGGLLPGLDRLLEEEIEIPVERYGIALGKSTAIERTGQNAEFALPYASACQAMLQRRLRIDLRRGDLTYKRDYRFLKRRAGMAAGFVLAILFSWIFSNYAEYRVLADKGEALRIDIKDATERWFGKPIYDKAEIEKLVGGLQVTRAPMPEKDAFDVIVELSKRIPFSVVHDVERLDVKPKKVSIKGIVDADLVSEDGTSQLGADAGPVDAGSDLSPIDLVKERLEAFDECFTAIRVGNVTVVGERRRYQMDIDSRCP